MPCHFLKLSDFSGETLRYMIDRAKVIKADLKAGKRYEPFAGKVLIMVFEKASTRTRVSFETGFYQLGGNVVNLQSQGSQIGRSESIADTARVISRMGDLIMMRTFGQDRLDDMAVHSRVPVINGLTNEYHPCQILTDILTFEEHCGPITGKTVAWVGDANNMAYTWIEAAKLLGFKLHFSSPKGYELDPALTLAGDHLKVFDDPVECCRGADLVTTDVWTSMGYEEENAVRREAFAKWQVHGRRQSGRRLHALPARPPRRGSHGRRHRWSAVRRLGRGRKPPACPEGHHGILPARPCRIRTLERPERQRARPRSIERGFRVLVGWARMKRKAPLNDERGFCLRI